MAAQLPVPSEWVPRLPWALVDHVQQARGRDDRVVCLSAAAARRRPLCTGTGLQRLPWRRRSTSLLRGLPSSYYDCTRVLHLQPTAAAQLKATSRTYWSVASTLRTS
jgi:hypothetical protein